MNPDRIPVVLGAVLLNIVVGMVVGPLFGNAGPMAWQFLGAMFGQLGERMDRPHRSYADLSLRGFFLTILILVPTALAGQGAQDILPALPAPGLAVVLLLSAFLTGGASWFMLLRLYTVMERKIPSEGAYYAIAHSSRVNLAAGDDFGVARAALGVCATAFDKGMVAPALWFLIGGFPALAVYSALSFMVWRFGKRGFTKGFASVPLALERLLGMVPSLLSAIFITLAAAFTPTARVHRGLLSWFGAKGRAPYEQGGYPLSALAWSLNVSLGGAAQDLGGSAMQGVWVGPEKASARIEHHHIRRAIYIVIVAHLLFVAALLGAYLWAHILLPPPPA